MADLYNLDAELADEDDDSEEEQQQVVGDNEDDLPQQQQQQWETGNSADDRATYSTNDDAVPDVLQEAARARNRIHARNDYDDNQEGDDYEQQDEEEELEGDDWQQTMTLKSAELQRQNIAYSLLHKAWWQECQSPELCPLDHDTVAEMISCATASLELLNANEEHGAGSHAFVPATNNANITALLESIVRIDAERVKFLLADLFKRRLQKIEAHPLHMRTLTERMSEPEVRARASVGCDKGLCSKWL